MADPAPKNPGDYFSWEAGQDFPIRWDPLRQLSLPWPLPKQEEAKEATWPELMRGIAKKLGSEDESAAENGDKATEEEKPESAAKGASDLYSKAVEGYRETLKWFVGALAVLPAALIGTAPFSGLGNVIRNEGITSGPVIAFGVSVLALVAIALVVAWVSRPVLVTTASLANRGSDGSWQRKFWNMYADDWVLFLDGRATNLKEFKLYREAWLGIIADIERELELESVPKRAEDLKRYLEIAETRRDDDNDTVSANLSRGETAWVARKSVVGATSVFALATVAVLAFVAYLGGTVNQGPPVIESAGITMPENKTPAIGQPLAMQVVASGTGFTYRWSCDGDDLLESDRVVGTQGPLLQIRTFSANDFGTYQVTVTDKEGNDAFSKKLEVTLPPPSNSITPNAGEPTPVPVPSGRCGEAPG